MYVARLIIAKRWRSVERSRLLRGISCLRRACVLHLLSRRSLVLCCSWRCSHVTFLMHGAVEPWQALDRSRHRRRGNCWYVRPLLSISVPRTLACSFMRVAVLDVASSRNSATSEDHVAIAAFQAPPPPIAMDGKDFSALHAFHRNGSNVVVGNSPAKTILLSIRSEIRKEESVLSATRK